MLIRFLHSVWGVTNDLMNLVEDSNLISVLVAVVAFYYVGERAVAGHLRMREVGLMVGLLSLLGYVAWRYSTIGIRSGGDLALTALRSILFGGLAATFYWMLTPLFAFFYEHTCRFACRLLLPPRR